MTLSSTAVIEVQTAQSDPSIGISVPVEELERLIEAVSVQIDEYLDRPVIQRQVSEQRLLGRRRGERAWDGDSKVRLDHRPVVSVVSIQDENTPDPQELTSDDYFVHKAHGILESRHLRGFPEPVGFWTVTYTVGLWANRAAVDHRVRRAAIKLIVAHRSRPDPTVVEERIGNLSLKYGASGASGETMVAEIPADVRALLDPLAHVGV